MSNENKKNPKKKIITGVMLFLTTILFAVLVYYFSDIKTWFEVYFNKRTNPNDQSKPKETTSSPTPQNNPNPPQTTGNQTLTKEQAENLQENLNALNSTNFSPTFGTKPDVFPLVVDGNIGNKTKSALAYFGFDTNGNYLHDPTKLPVWFSSNYVESNNASTWWSYFFKNEGDKPTID